MNIYVGNLAFNVTESDLRPFSPGLEKYPL